MIFEARRVVGLSAAGRGGRGGCGAGDGEVGLVDVVHHGRTREHRPEGQHVESKREHRSERRDASFFGKKVMTT